MRKRILGFILAICLMFPLAISLAGCFDTLGGGGGTKIDNSVDLVDATPNEEHQDDGKDYYTSKKLQLVTDINGSYKVGREFYLDPENNNRRVYDDIYFYEDDYFKMDEKDSPRIYYQLENSEDLEYVSVVEDYGRLKINAGKSGIYKLVFDITTFKFDVEYKSEIITPKYETIENCDIYSLATSWQQMTKNSENQDEFVINNFCVASKKSISFFSHNIHTSRYKVTLDESAQYRYAYQIGTKSSPDVYMMIGGTYNVYINSKTYVVRFELVSANADGYSAIVYKDGNFVDLELADQNVNYIFKYRYEATRDIGGYGVMSDDVPDIYNASYQKYNLTPTDDSMTYLRAYSSGGYYFKTRGTYDLTINLLDFTITIEKLPE